MSGSVPLQSAGLGLPGIPLGDILPPQTFIVEVFVLNEVRQAVPGAQGVVAVEKEDISGFIIVVIIIDGDCVQQILRSFPQREVLTTDKLLVIIIVAPVPTTSNPSTTVITVQIPDAAVARSGSGVEETLIRRRGQQSFTQVTLERRGGFGFTTFPFPPSAFAVIVTVLQLLISSG